MPPTNIDASLKRTEKQAYEVEDAVKKAVEEDAKQQGGSSKRLGTFSMRDVSVCFSQSEMMIKFKHREQDNRIILPYHEDVCNMFSVGGRTLYEIIAQTCQSESKSEWFIMVDAYEHELEHKLAFLYKIVTQEYCKRQGFYDTERTTEFLTFLTHHPRAHKGVVLTITQILSCLPDVNIIDKLQTDKKGIQALNTLLSAECMRNDGYLQLKRNFLSALLGQAGGASSDVETQSQ